MLKEVRIKSRIYQKPPKKGEGIRLAIFQAERPVGTTAAMLENLKQLESQNQKKVLNQ